MYCGTDIIEVDRVKSSIESNDKFKERVFTQKEILDIDKCKTDVKYERYAGRFAAKEAIFKALSEILINNELTLDFNEIEIENITDYKRRPKVNILSVKVQELLNIKNIKIDISISHIKSTAVAMCVVSLKS